MQRAQELQLVRLRGHSAIGPWNDAGGPTPGLGEGHEEDGGRVRPRRPARPRGPRNPGGRGMVASGASQAAIIILI